METSNPSAQPTTAYRWAVVGMLWFICFFNYADRQAISSVLPLLKDEYGFDATQRGMIVSAFMWVYALTAPFAGQTVDRFARKTIILAGLYVWSLVTGLTALCSKLWQFVGVRAAEGLGETFYFPASMSMVGDYHDQTTRSRAMSLHQTSVYIGTIGGGWLAGWMAERWNWRVPFLVFGGLGIVLGLVLALFIREPPRGSAIHLTASEPGSHGWRDFLRDIGHTMNELRRIPTAIALIVAFFGANAVAMIFISWMPTFLKEKFEMSLTWAGLSATIYLQVASAFGSVAGGVLADRWRYRAGGRILVQAIGLFVGMPFVFLCGQTPQIKVLIVAMTLFGFCKGLYDSNIWASLFDVVPESRRGSAVGLMNMIGWIGGSLGVTLVGVAVDRGTTMSVALASTAVIYLSMGTLLAVAALYLAPRDVERSR